MAHLVQRVLVVLFGVVAVLAVVAFLLAVKFGHLWVLNMAASMEDVLEEGESAAAEHVEPWLADAARFSLRERALRASTRSDAGPYLNPRLRWKGPGVDAWRAGAKPTIGEELTFPAGTDEYLATRWPKVTLAELELGPVDLGWLRDLERFDHWDIDAGSPPVPEGVYGRGRSVELGPLISWARVRFLVARERHDVADALREVRHLRDLLLTTEKYEHVIVATSLMRLEGEAFSVEPWAVNSPDLGPTSSEEVAMVKRFFWASPAFFDLTASPETMEAIERGAGGSMGFCVGLEEATTKAVILPAAASSDTFRDQVATLRAMAERSKCRWARARELWRVPRGDVIREMVEEYPWPQSMVARAVLLYEDAREASTKLVVNIMLQRFFDQYDQPTEAVGSDEPAK